MAKLMEGEGPQCKNGGAARQRLADRFVQLRLMAAGQEKLPTLVALINYSLDVGEQSRETLHLVQDAATFHLAKKSSWVGFCRHPKIRVLQGKVRFVWKGHPG